MNGFRVDTHLHTRFSECSSVTVDFLIERGRDPGIHAICCTDHHSLMATHQLRSVLPDRLVIPAIEVDTREGDVLVYSEDMDYLESLIDFDGSVRDLRRDETTCLVWAHPCVSQRVSLVGADFSDAARVAADPNLVRVADVLPHVDGLEIYNGQMLSLYLEGMLQPAYFRNLIYVAETFGVACTGGSDAHETESWGTVWTNFPERLGSVRDFVRAIRDRRVNPEYDRRVYPTDLGFER
ncbi:MAG: PHP domain-containing protein [Deltaproteobacteria bacterium]|nr:PHP domain-containing protein [Deltaproteobacteria bacterium]